MDIEEQQVEDVLRVAAELGLTCRRLAPHLALDFRKRTLAKFRPFRVSGHVGIGFHSDVYPLGLAELDFSESFPAGPVLIFFDQDSTVRQEVLELAEGQRLSQLMPETDFAEYFAGGPSLDYLVAVNWYVVEVAGAAREWMRARYPLGTGTAAP